MDHRIFKIPVLGWIFRTSKAIPIAPAREDRGADRSAPSTESPQALPTASWSCIFPEGS